MSDGNIVDVLSAILCTFHPNSELHVSGLWKHWKPLQLKVFVGFAMTKKSIKAFTFDVCQVVGIRCPAVL